jgi:hypothetical protein
MTAQPTLKPPLRIRTYLSDYMPRGFGQLAWRLPLGVLTRHQRGAAGLRHRLLASHAQPPHPASAYTIGHSG